MEEQMKMLSDIQDFLKEKYGKENVGPRCLKDDNNPYGQAYFDVKQKLSESSYMKFTITVDLTTHC